ncbi:hypothetical protein CUMW_025520, partial [Citrus unshiu]
EEKRNKVVCITGVSGFIASWLVNLLLQRAYIVKATVRDPSQHTDHLRELDGAKERLLLLKANLLEEGSFDSAVDGCEERCIRVILSSFKCNRRTISQREPMSGEGKVVCVTGASGFIASWLVKLLLQRSYTVKATVRDLNNHNAEHLLTLDGAEERLHLFKANLLEDGSFDSAVDGCEGVFHTASPVVVSANDPQAEIIDPAVKGTLNVLRSCARVDSIKRVVVTSSIVSTLFTGTPLTPDVIVDEMWFSDLDVCKELKHWYAISKTLAEQAAWKFAEENGIDLVTIHPGLVLGPLLQPNLNLSVEVILKLIQGSPIYPSPYRLVDVRDVAHAHIQALEVPMANGRYMMVGRVTHDNEVVNFLCQNYPAMHLPEKSEDYKYEPTYHVSQERAKSLGINFMPWELSLEGEGLPPFLATAAKGKQSDIFVQMMMSGEGEGKVVCVTGASGFIASWLVKLLLQRGYTVNATKWYPLAKTLAEEAAWKFARENGIDLVAINPGIVIGPFFHPILNFGADVILNLINGAQSFPSPYRFVDIRDVAYAQIQALEVPTANGRYLLVGSVVQLYDILKFLHEHYPTLLVAGNCVQMIDNPPDTAIIAKSYHARRDQKS